MIVPLRMKMLSSNLRYHFCCKFWICKFIFHLLANTQKNLSWNKLSRSGWTMRKIQHHPALLNKLWFQIKGTIFDYEKFQFRLNLIWTEIFPTLEKFSTRGNQKRGVISQSHGLKTGFRGSVSRQSTLTSSGVFPKWTVFFVVGANLFRISKVL